MAWVGSLPEDTKTGRSVQRFLKREQENCTGWGKANRSTLTPSQHEGESMDHQQRHHEHHEKEREHEKELRKEHEHQEEHQPRSLHPAWFVVVGIFLIGLVMVLWTVLN
jgi:hypothetical protein